VAYTYDKGTTVCQLYEVGPGVVLKTLLFHCNSRIGKIS